MARSRLTLSGEDDTLKRARYKRFKRALCEGDPESVARMFDLPLVGYGSARNAYGIYVDHLPPTVLKVLAHGAGQEDIEQMKVEISCMRDMQGHPLIPTLVDYDENAKPHPRWMELERLETLFQEEFALAFQHATGITWDRFTLALLQYGGSEALDAETQFKLAVEDIAPASRSRAEAFLRELGEVVQNCELMPVDFAKSDNWGFTPEGRIKLIDLGLTEDVARTLRGNPTLIDQIKRRLLSINPDVLVPLPPLPVIQRGMYPQLIIGQVGHAAVYKYRHAELEIGPSKFGTWYVLIYDPPGTARDTYETPTYSDAVCTGKITIDLDRVRGSLHSDDWRNFVHIWDLVYKTAILLRDKGVQPNRAAVAHQLADFVRQARRHAAYAKYHGRPRPIEPQYLWFEALPLRDRIQLIDDRLEYARCMYGPPKAWR